MASTVAACWLNSLAVCNVANKSGNARAAILSAEGSKQSAILTAEGERQAAVLKARGDSEALVLRAEADAMAQAARARGQAEAISTVFRAIHEGNPDQRLLAYQYMQMLPQIAQGDAKQGLDRAERDLQGAGGHRRFLQRGQHPVRRAARASRIRVGASRVGGAGRGPVVRAGA